MRPGDVQPPVHQPDGEARCDRGKAVQPRPAEQLGAVRHRAAAPRPLIARERDDLVAATATTGRVLAGAVPLLRRRCASRTATASTTIVVITSRTIRIGSSSAGSADTSANAFAGQPPPTHEAHGVGVG